jgi:hypothetical protein
VAEAEVVVAATIAAAADSARAARYGAMMVHPCHRRTVARHGDVVPSSNSVQRDPRKVAETSPAAEKKRRRRHYIELESVRYVTAESNQIS